MVMVSPVSSRARPPALGELFHIDRDQHLGSFPAAGHGAGVVRGRQLDEGVGSSLFGGAARFVEAVNAYEIVDGVAQHPPRFGLEQALDADHPIQRSEELQRPAAVTAPGVGLIASRSTTARH